MPGIMEGVRVLEVGTWVAIPSAGAILADWGAEVIKVENPQGGDPWRNFISMEGVEGRDTWWQLVNRGKKSIALNLNHPRGQQVAHRLAAAVDVLVTNLQSDSLQKFHLDYTTLSGINPRLVFGHLTGYGSRGPDRDLPGFDYSAFWARSGVMDRVSEPRRPPRPNRAGFGDNTTSLAVAAGLSAALFNRERTGKGQEVHFSLYHTAVWALSIEVEAALALKEQIPQSVFAQARNPLWNTYQTADGRWIQLVMLQPDKYWSNFCVAIDRTDLLSHRRFATAAGRSENCRALNRIIAQVLRTRSLREWETVLRAHGIVFGRVQTVLETVQDPQAWENGFFSEIQTPNGPLPLVNGPIQFPQTPPMPRGLAPELGQHTEEVLTELGGVSWQEIGELQEAGVIPG